MLTPNFIPGQIGIADTQQKTLVPNVINGGLEHNSPQSLDNNGWPNTFQRANINQATIRVNASGGNAPAWTAANTEIAHNLGKIPTGWRIVYQDKVVTLIAGTTAPTTQYIYLTISDPTANVTLEIF